MTKQTYTTRTSVVQYRPLMSEAEYSQLQGESLGFCLACGEIAESGVEPDARRYRCESCGQPKVYGLEELLIMGLIVFSEDGPHP